MIRVRNILTAGLMLGLTGSMGYAGIIVQNTAGAQGTRTEFFGQSFTTPANGPFSSFTFSFYADLPPTTLSAAGPAFLLTQAYLGTPANLSTSTPGFLAQSTGISGNAYVFSPTLILQSSTKYYLYENTTLTASGGNAVPGAEAYFSLGANTAFTTANTIDLTGLQSSNFVVNATAAVSASAPEPGTLLLLPAGMLAVFLKRRRAVRQ